MNIRATSNPVNPVEVTTTEAASVKTDQSHQDRDADGRHHGEEPDKNPLSEDEMKKARKYLENLEGLKTNNLSYEIELKDALKIFLIKDPEGNIVRRIPEHEMRLLIAHTAEESSGKIFSRTG